MKLKKPQDSLKRQDKSWIKNFSPVNRANKINNSTTLFKVQNAGQTSAKEADQAKNEQKTEDLNSSKTDQDNVYGVTRENVKKKSPMKSIHTLSEVLQKRDKTSVSLISAKNSNLQKVTKEHGGSFVNQMNNKPKKIQQTQTINTV